MPLMQKFAFWHRINVYAIAALLGCWLIFFSRILIGQYVYFLDDLKIIYLPLEYAFSQFQHSGQLPQWSPYFGFGHPLLAWAQLGFFTPLHVLLRALFISPLNLLQISIVSYFAIGLIGFYAWLRQLPYSPSASALGAIIFAFSGFSVGHIHHVNFYTATMPLPWLLLSLHIFFQKPTLRKTGLVVLMASLIALSGQPQIILYTFVAGLLYGLVIFASQIPKHSFNYSVKIVSLGALAIALILALSSFTLLPLKEFLPETERNGDLPVAELFEFSYPPIHAITLIFPYFFGDHSHYWGAKGFQELAAYVGILPLLLTGLSLSQWSRQRVVRLWAMLLLVLSITGALGQYSPIYRYLVENHILSTLTTPGRFVYFFTLAIAILAATGLDDIRYVITDIVSQRKRWLLAASGMALVAILLGPFIFQLPYNNQLLEGLLKLPISSPYHVGLTLFAAALFLGVIFTRQSTRISKLVPGLITLTVALTLISYGWSYTPLTPRSVATPISPFMTPLTTLNQTTGLPPRIYATQQSIVEQPAIGPFKKTDTISPQFTMYQPFIAQNNNLSCLTFPFHYATPSDTTVTVSILSDFNQSPLREQKIKASDFSSQDRQQFCFPPLEDSAGKKYILGLSSDHDSGLQLYYQLSLEPQNYVFFVRKTNPSIADIRSSTKPFQLVMDQEYSAIYDFEAAFLVRHLQVLVQASSARWIGALSIRPYREFIEDFFANDRDPIDGDGVHALMKNRTILDMTGVTHIIQPLPSSRGATTLMNSGFTLVDQTNTGQTEIGLYQNNQAFPKTWLVANAIYKAAADETRHAMHAPDFDPSRLIYISGTKPPPETAYNREPLISSQATITQYTPTVVEIVVKTDKPAWLVLNDAATPQWQTYVDDQPQPYYVANTIFRTTPVPAGKHIVSFHYVSPAIAQAKIATGISLFLVLLMLILPELTSTVRFEKNVQLNQDSKNDGIR